MRLFLIDNHRKHVYDKMNENICGFYDASGYENHIRFSDIDVSDADAVLLNIESTTQTRGRASFKAIELIYWLRLKYKFYKPIISYGFLPVSEILRIKPEYIILQAPGIYHKQLPFDFNKIIEFATTLKEQDLNENNFRQKYFSFIKPNFKVELLRHSYANIYGLKSASDIFNTVFGGKEDFISEKANEKIISLQYEIGNFLSSHANQTIDGNFKKEIKTTSNEIKNLHPKILFIDDYADYGWSEFLRKSFCKENTQFITIIPKKDLQTDKLIKTIFKNIKSEKPDIIFLDLRLADEKGYIQDINRLSGVVVLESIHKSFPHLPIIIVSATNKSYVMAKVLAKGAISLWTKPGIDENRSLFDYIKEYYSLLSTVKRILTRFKFHIEKIIFETEYNLALGSNKNKQRIFFDYYDIILIDTNILFKTDDSMIKTFKSIDGLLKYIKNKPDPKSENETKPKRKPKIIIINDVFHELLIYATQPVKTLKISDADFFLKKKPLQLNEAGVNFANAVSKKNKKKYSLTYDENTIYEAHKNNTILIKNIEEYNLYTRIISAKYALSKITDYIQNEYIENDFKNSEDSINAGITYSVEDKKGLHYLTSIYRKDIAGFDTKSKANTEKKTREENNKKTLHADDTFMFLIAHYLDDNKNVLFISNDVGCKENIINHIKLRFPGLILSEKKKKKKIDLTNEEGIRLSLIHEDIMQSKI